MFLAHLYLWRASHCTFILLFHVGGGKSIFSHLEGTLLLGSGALRVEESFGPQPLLSSSALPWPISDSGDI